MVNRAFKNITVNASTNEAEIQKCFKINVKKFFIVYLIMY